MENNEIIKKAALLRSELGGSILAFPIESENQFSKYAVVVYVEKYKYYHVFPIANDISEASMGIQTIIEQEEKRGKKINFKRDVRLISFEPQYNAPSIPMRLVKKEEEHRKSDLKHFNEDFIPNGDGFSISPRGLLKMSYWLTVDENNLKAVALMDKFYGLLETRKYGKTTDGIKQEINKMNKVQVNRWIDNVYEKYVFSGQEILNMMN